MQPVGRKAAPGFFTAPHKPEAAEVALDGDGSCVSFSLPQATDRGHGGPPETGSRTYL